jgi:predicted nucleotidyltransferase
MLLKGFSEKHGGAWTQLIRAQELTKQIREKIIRSLDGQRIFSSDVDLVVFGSIARDECTNGSDVDWTLLVDGQANPGHLGIAHFIEEVLDEAKLAGPGATGMFGQITFSHDLIHYIGGKDDSNHNLSRRILLLLESDRISLDSTPSGTAYDRVILGIIQQYIDNDSGFTAGITKERVPRFLLNDIVRFWRTMCVDFAYKQREQRGKKWALRNIKLRMSRRLIFIKGVLLCFKSYKSSWDTDRIKEELVKNVAITPLEFVISVFLECDIPEDLIIQLLDSYNTYLEMLNDEEFRGHLENIEMSKAFGDSRFEAARKNSHDFQNTLSKIFFEEKSAIREFTLKYGFF